MLTWTRFWWALPVVLCPVCSIVAFAASLRALARGRHLTARVTVAVCGGLSVPGLFLFPIFVLPKFRDIWMEFDVALPAATELLIDISHCVLQYWFILVPVFGAGLVAVFLLPAVLKGRWSLHLSASFSLVVTAFWLLSVVAMFLPLVKLTSSLGRGG